MPRFLSFPHEPVARFRVLAVWFAATIAFLNVGMFAFDAQIRQPLRWELAVAAALLCVWWTAGYRRGGFPTAGWLVDAALVTLVSAWSPMPLRAIGVFYFGIQLRALYVRRRELPLLLVSYAAARIASIAIGPDQASFGALVGTSAVQVIGLTVIAVTLHLFVDATERHAAIEHALVRSDERYRLVASAMRDVVYDWNVASGTIDWTASMQQVFGFAADAVRPDLAWWLDRVHPEDRATLKRDVAHALADPAAGVSTVAYRVRRADESWAHVSGSVIVQRDAGGAPARVVGSIRDVTAEQQLAERLRQSQKMEAVGQLAGGVAHDFNNLLTVIGGHVYMLRDAATRAAAGEPHLHGITRAADRAAALIKQLLAFSRKQILTPSMLDLNAVVEDVLQMIRPVIGEHVEIVTRLDPDLAPVFADAGQLGQVLVNLVLNARDAMPGGGTLTIETRNATLGPRADDATAVPLPAGEYARLTVRDTGGGMDAETLSRIFEPFFTTKPTGQGTGLGLATVYGIVKQSSGDVQVVSAPGAGTSFTIHLPVTERPAEGAEPRRSADARPAQSARSRAVLLVEDDDGVREFAHEVLSRAGCQVRSARNGVDALEQLRAAGASIDVVVTDIVMPEMGGRELVERLRQSLPGLPVLYITGYADDPRMLGDLYAADIRLLGKPFTAAALERAVEEVAQGVRA